MFLMLINLLQACLQSRSSVGVVVSENVFNEDCSIHFHIVKKNHHNFVAHVFIDEPNLSMFERFFCEMLMK